MAQIAPWLYPKNFVEAMNAGAQAGLAVRRATDEEQQAGDRLRLAYDQLASQEKRESEAARSKLELAHAAMALRARQADAMEAYHQNQIAARNEALKQQQQYQNSALALRQQAMDERKSGKEYGDVEYQDVPGVPGAKVALRKGSPGMHVIQPQREGSHATLDAARIRAAQALPTTMAKIKDMEVGTPEYNAATNAVSMVQDFLKRTAPQPVGAANSPAGATHRFNPKTGKIEPISGPKASAQLMDTTDEEDDTED